MNRHGAVVVGLMSGTSLDGISAAVVRFADRQQAMDAELLAFTHRPYGADERARIEVAMARGSARDYCTLHADLGDWLAEAALAAMAQADVGAEDVECIASHGQTLWHEPGHSTWQIGDAARIAERTGCRVVSDFRTRDVAAGGQGAPLVPMADVLLFAHPTSHRALQNLGGIGNVTIVPPQAALDGDDANDLHAVRAFDTGPGVVLIDAMFRTLRPGLAYDTDGRLGAAGTPLVEVVDAALTNAYYTMEPPKSTGRELFSSGYADALLHACRLHGASDADVIATAVLLTARTIADQYTRFVPEPIADVVLSGGGAKNPTLVRAITRELARVKPDLTVTSFSTLFFDGEAKEAVAFALLGYLHITERPGNVPSATGARGARRLGTLTPA